MTALIGSLRVTLRVDKGTIMIRIKSQQDKWAIRRRYNEFRRLRDYALKVLRKQHDERAKVFLDDLESLPFPLAEEFESGEPRKRSLVGLQEYTIVLVTVAGEYQKHRRTLGHDDPRDGSEILACAIGKFLKTDRSKSKGKSPPKPPAGRRKSRETVSTPPSSGRRKSSREAVTPPPPGRRQSREGRSPSSRGSAASSPGRIKSGASDGSLSPAFQALAGKKRYSTQLSKTLSLDSSTSSNADGKCSVTSAAERELAKAMDAQHVDVVMRYIDRLLNKAFVRTPGCYRISQDGSIEWDAERLYEDIEMTFPDLPHKFIKLFKRSSGEWLVPPRMRKYIDKRWKDHAAAGNGSDSDSNSDSNSSHSDSDDDSEYEYTAVRKVKMPKGAFTQDQIGELEQMEANGVAGRDQMTLLKKQFVIEKQLAREQSSSSSEDSYDDESTDDDLMDEDEEETVPSLSRSRSAARARLLTGNGDTNRHTGWGIAGSRRRLQN